MPLGHILEAFLSGDPGPLLSASVGAMFEGAKDAFNDVLKDLDPRNEFKKDLTNWVKSEFNDWMPGPTSSNASRRT
jgi:hypothetical protein